MMKLVLKNSKYLKSKYINIIMMNGFGSIVGRHGIGFGYCPKFASFHYKKSAIFSRK